MAIVFNAAADRLLRTANLPDDAGPYTIMGWARFTTDSGGEASLASLNSDGYSGISMVMLRLGETGNPVAIYQDSATGYFNGGNQTVNTWFHFALIRSAAGTCALHIGGNATPAASVTDSLNTLGTPTRLEFGSHFSTNAEVFTGELAAIKVWNVALSTTDLASEWQYRNAQTNLGNINFVWRCITATADADGYNDSSGNGRNATVGGALTTASDPAGILGNDPAGGTNATVNETVAITDTATFTISYDRTVNETIAYIESISTGDTYNRTVSETITIVDAPSTSETYSVSVNETIGFATELIGIGFDYALPTESISLFDARNASSGDVGGAGNETVSITDSATFTISYDRSVAETISYTETLGFDASAPDVVNRSAGSTIVITDTASFYISGTGTGGGAVGGEVSSALHAITRIC